MKKFFIILAIIIGIFIVYYYLDYTKILSRNISIPKTDLTPSAKNNQLDNAPAISIFRENLAIPWAIAFLPDGNLLVTERPGKLDLISKNGSSSTLLGNISVKAEGEGGLLGVAVSPNFSQNKNIYLYYTFASSDSNNMLNRVVKYKLDNNKLAREKILVDNIPSGSNHDGGRIKFGPDGYLYITTGDGEQPSLAQSKNTLGGKILRITEDGNPAPGNPFANAQGKPTNSTQNPLIYSYGHRNPQGITWDNSGQLWETEHGRSIPLSGLDEINKISPGLNYGWPIIQGDEKKEGMVTPVLNSTASVTWAPSGTAFLNGSLFFGGLKGNGLYQYDINTGKLSKYLDGKLGRIREVVVGPDGFLYITTSNTDGRGTPSEGDDKILKVNPKKLSEL
ncbi:MAG TPA: PQQ-dependent sugar dehydrogenase [Patescibacteria group bacterium]|nr:PQQ-dependent sugar dehydrogenase [Patescibacteria group bacterium]